ncbi:MAG: entericidin A/B family lipoprotein [Zymomonas mobilis subsp. pomaceae]|uniref:Entericidin EcnAB n=1 Tax=Zymomonas mobilis subsp. pomaceae (strain ATCC 29192 / DSM 22645 / JCM 10191 / CCUG 17912 / NBRC 13757 / NCIMB 11200 / NRRL B-4491 / Barker I) TaxID=579138 RepID=F8ETA4_ZYMMT|nr:entericidin A/B family lipoprotein [Zymomonas mobilis]AEI36994.1 Entericidin EcnAB [Zymomonas mobilis subsp. pomaceae ATCC 29192]MDX5948366.1 entericidin A/B family lipoprotein [Zymomonas mobilis subsp. pomaceae]GEB89645.1 hypothetical protein ZMO02_12820 [Zymomonas mobilis subsp. pomaceae]
MRVLIGLFIASSLLGLSACNTVQGFGQDMSSAGQSMANSAERHK